mmetsp:Transcript_21071/g.31367  ORF Transcript_21071/g.31367 Transcript_21071/m.31367 type:complete len:262 (+) Transcript_21071:31-816(+)
MSSSKSDIVQFSKQGKVVSSVSTQHHHDHDHGHTHEHLDGPGLFVARDKVIPRRDYSERAFTVGIGGPVGSGKTALVLSLCKHLRDKLSIVVVTNDIFTKEDGEFLTRNKALSDPGRIVPIETGGCPHAAVREDVTINLLGVKKLTAKYKPDLALLESGGDNLAANFSRELADYIIYVVDVAGGDKVPRKGGPGITQSDLLIINKTDLADAVGADIKLMHSQAIDMRQKEGPVVLAQVKHMKGVEEIANHILEAMEKAKSN